MGGRTTATGLALAAIGAILAFAVTTTTPGFSLHAAGFVLIAVGAVALAVPGSPRDCPRRRFTTRRTRTGPQGTVVETKEAELPPYVARNPGTAIEDAGLGGVFPSIPPDPGVQEMAFGPDKGPGRPAETGIRDGEFSEEETG